MRLLVLSLNTFPYPPNHGAAEGRTFNLLKYLGSHHDVTLVAHKTRNATADNVQALKDWVNAVKLFPLPRRPSPQATGTNTFEQALRFAQFIVTATPPQRLPPILSTGVRVGESIH